MTDTQLFALIQDMPLLVFLLYAWWQERKERIEAQNRLFEHLASREELS